MSQIFGTCCLITRQVVFAIAKSTLYHILFLCFFRSLIPYRLNAPISCTVVLTPLIASCRSVLAHTISARLLLDVIGTFRGHPFSTYARNRQFSINFPMNTHGMNSTILPQWKSSACGNLYVTIQRRLIHEHSRNTVGWVAACTVTP